jgi:hypothetical protein
MAVSAHSIDESIDCRCVTTTFTPGNTLNTYQLLGVTFKPGPRDGCVAPSYSFSVCTLLEAMQHFAINLLLPLPQIETKALFISEP